MYFLRFFSFILHQIPFFASFGLFCDQSSLRVRVAGSRGDEFSDIDSRGHQLFAFIVQSVDVCCVCN